MLRIGMDSKSQLAGGDVLTMTSPIHDLSLQNTGSRFMKADESAMLRDNPSSHLRQEMSITEDFRSEGKGVVDD